uniref:hypothetical protein n=1 Tax=Herbidospora sakaeratensis TaxID=564415 RepID=UPI000ABFAE70|nr:hypothetical protein [Herbidospora sakaeratensis]
MEAQESPAVSGEEPPRGRSQRLIRTLLLWIPFILGPVALDRVLAFTLDVSSLNTAQLLARDLLIVLPVIPMLLVARRVSYRRRDCLVYVLVPLGMVFAFILFWRLSYLPYRDWSLRPDEAADRSGGGARP